MERTNHWSSSFQWICAWVPLLASIAVRSGCDGSALPHSPLQLLKSGQEYLPPCFGCIAAKYCSVSQCLNFHTHLEADGIVCPPATSLMRGHVDGFVGNLWNGNWLGGSIVFLSKKECRKTGREDEGHFGSPAHCSRSQRCNDGLGMSWGLPEDYRLSLELPRLSKASVSIPTEQICFQCQCEKRRAARVLKSEARCGERRLHSKSWRPTEKANNGLFSSWAVV